MWFLVMQTHENDLPVQWDFQGQHLVSVHMSLLAKGIDNRLFEVHYQYDWILR
jgi:hypothetical protein